jgi:hypothetical protein
MMRMRTMGWLGVVALLLAVAVPALAQPAGEPGSSDVSASDLVLTGATVETQVDVNGAAAVSLIGGALDALVTTAQEQAKAAQEAAGGALPPEALIALQAAQPVLEPVRDALKSFTRATIIEMKVAKPVPQAQFLRHYQTVMAPHGWTSLITIQDGDSTVLAMLGPQGKGLFGAVADAKSVTVAMVTTSRPLGDLLGQLVTASGKSMPAVMGAVMKAKAQAHSGAPAPPEAPKSGK